MAFFISITLVRVIWQIGAGFASLLNQLWLIEMSHEVYTNGVTVRLLSKLLCILPEDATWKRGGKNAGMFSCALTTPDGHFAHRSILVLCVSQRIICFIT